MMKRRPSYNASGQKKGLVGKRKTTFVLRGKDNKKRTSAFPPRLVREVQTPRKIISAREVHETPAKMNETRTASARR